MVPMIMLVVFIHSRMPAPHLAVQNAVLEVFRVYFVAEVFDVVRLLVVHAHLVRGVLLLPVRRVDVGADRGDTEPEHLDRRDVVAENQIRGDDGGRRFQVSDHHAAHRAELADQEEAEQVEQGRTARTGDDPEPALHRYVRDVPPRLVPLERHAGDEENHHVERRGVVEERNAVDGLLAVHQRSLQNRTQSTKNAGAKRHHNADPRELAGFSPGGERASEADGQQAPVRRAVVALVEEAERADEGPKGRGVLQHLVKARVQVHQGDVAAGDARSAEEGKREYEEQLLGKGHGTAVGHPVEHENHGHSHHVTHQHVGDREPQGVLEPVLHVNPLRDVHEGHGNHEARDRVNDGLRPGAEGGGADERGAVVAV
mmetsp:Transcript_20966/g.52965  ORF Transcript_20966/g.52965 Transcript_20966/m.52965 type:complete len:371 (-) Transcript_20966:429-1541(-)